MHIYKVGDARHTGKCVLNILNAAGVCMCECLRRSHRIKTWSFVHRGLPLLCTAHTQLFGHVTQLSSRKAKHDNLLGWIVGYAEHVEAGGVHKSIFGFSQKIWAFGCLLVHAFVDG